MNNTATSIKIEIPADKIDSFCKQHHIREMALFGSVLRDDFRPDSDIDILIEFEPDAGVGYSKFFRLQDELTRILGRDVDLFTPNSLKPFAREMAVETKKVIYAV